MEDAAHGSKRETGQQLRELQVEHGAAVRQLASLQEAAARTQEKLKVGVHSSQARFLLPPNCSRLLDFHIGLCTSCPPCRSMLCCPRRTSKCANSNVQCTRCVFVHI